MSSILKALKKLEAEREKPDVELAGQVAQYEETSPGSGRLRLVLLLAGGIALGGVAVGGWFFGGSEQPVSEPSVGSSVAQVSEQGSAAPVAETLERAGVQSVNIEAGQSDNRRAVASRLLVPPAETKPIVPPADIKKPKVVAPDLPAQAVKHEVVAASVPAVRADSVAAPVVEEVRIPEEKIAQVEPVVEASVSKAAASEPPAVAAENVVAAVSEPSASLDAAVEPVVEEIRLSEETIAQVTPVADTASLTTSAASESPAEVVEDVVAAVPESSAVHNAAAPVVEETSLSAEPAVQDETGPGVVFTGLKVTEIFFNPEGGSMAVVDDLPVMEGTVIDGVLIQQILEDKVHFKIDGVLIAIPLKTEQ